MILIKRLGAPIFFLFLLALCPPLTWGGEQHQQVPDLTPEASTHVQRVMASRSGDLFVVFGNGLTLLVNPSRESPVVSAQVFVRAGSIHEGPNMGSGLSHYLEHVVSGGTTRSFTEEEATERLERIGGQTNAYTSYDRTVYFINTAARHWQEALDLLLSYVSQSTLDPDEVIREKSVIQQEMKMGENNPGRELWKLFMETAYRVHPVRKPVIGFEQVFIQQERAALLNYFLERYQPSNMVVVVAGGVNPQEVVKFVGEKTADFSRRAAPPTALPQEPPQLSPRWQERRLPFARLTQATIGFPSVALQDPDLYALDVLANLLGQGRSSRLYSRLKDDENRVLSVSASNWTPSFVTGQFMVFLSLSPQHWPAVLQPMMEEMERFKTHPVAEDELEKAKKQAMAQHIFGRETASDRASSLGSSFFDTGDPYFDTFYLDNIRKVTPEQIRQAAVKYLDPDRMNVAVIHPQATGETGGASVREPGHESPEGREIDSRQASNGLKVLLKQDPLLPMVTLHLYGLGGLYLEEGHPPGIAAFTSSLLTAGTKNRSKMDIARAIEEVGGVIESRSDNNTYRVSIKVLKDDLELALDLLSDVVRNPIFPQEELDKQREETLLALASQDASWQGEIMRLFRQHYFDHSPYRNDRLGTPESIQALTRDDVVRFYEKMVNPARSVLAIYGDIDPSSTWSLIEKKLSSWEGHTQPLPDFPRETAPLRQNRVEEKRNDKTASALFVGTNGLDIGSESRPVLDVLDAVLSGTGYPGGRLFKALRGGSEDLVYMVGAFPFYGKDAGFYGVLTQTTLANLQKVQDIILTNLQRLRTELVPEDELEKMKDLLIATRRLDLESLDARAQSASVNEVLGLGWRHDEQYPELIRQVTAEQVQVLAEKLFANTLVVRTIPENPVEILVVPPPPSDIHPPR